jgi:hypothetical protein
VHLQRNGQGYCLGCGLGCELVCGLVCGSAKGSVEPAPSVECRKVAPLHDELDLSAKCLRGALGGLATKFICFVA